MWRPHIGPILYLLYSMDILKCIDDLKIFRKITNHSDRVELKLVLDRVSEWADDNYLSLNHEKTKLLTFKQNDRCGVSSSYYRIELKGCLNLDLGVIFDEKLDHLSHLLTVLKSMSSLAYRLSRAVNSSLLFMKVLKTYLFPLIEYGYFVK